MDSFAEKLAYWREHGLNVSPAATPTRRNSVPPATPNNSFERGVPKDSRGMPFFDERGGVIGQKEYITRRREIEAGRRRAHNS